jgi:excisionase family DNA binding protein
MPRFHVWVSQLRTLDVLVDADSLQMAEARVRARLKVSPDAESWLDSATVIRSMPHDDKAALGANGANMSTPRQLLNASEAGRYLGISRTKVLELFKSGALESVMIGSLRRVSVEQLQRFVQSQTSAR